MAAYYFADEIQFQSDKAPAPFMSLKNPNNIICTCLPGSSPIIVSSCLIFATALWDAKLYNKGLWDTRKQRGVSSRLGSVAGVSTLSEGVSFGEEGKESGMSVRNIHPGEWLNAKEGSANRQNMDFKSMITSKRITSHWRSWSGYRISRSYHYYIAHCCWVLLL